MKNIWKLSENLNIYSCHHVYREGNRTTDCITKKGIISIIDSRIWTSNFPKDVTNISFEDYYDYLSNRPLLA